MNWPKDTERTNKLKAAGLYSDEENGLYLAVAKTGTKSPAKKVEMNGKRSSKGLGGYPALSLTAARKKAVESRDLMAAGVNPWGAALYRNLGLAQNRRS